MANATKSADMKHSLRMIQSMVRDSIQQVSGLDDHLKDSTEQLKHILGLHKLIDVETKKGKGLIKTLETRGFWDKHLYKLVFIIYLIVVFISQPDILEIYFIESMIDMLDIIMVYILVSGFNWVCPEYQYSFYSSPTQDIDDITQDEIYNEQFDTK